MRTWQPCSCLWIGRVHKCNPPYACNSYTKAIHICTYEMRKEECKSCKTHNAIHASNTCMRQFKCATTDKQNERSKHTDTDMKPTNAYRSLKSVRTAHNQGHLSLLPPPPPPPHRPSTLTRCRCKIRFLYIIKLFQNMILLKQLSGNLFLFRSHCPKTSAEGKCETN